MVKEEGPRKSLCKQTSTEAEFLKTHVGVLLGGGKWFFGRHAGFEWKGKIIHHPPSNSCLYLSQGRCCLFIMLHGTCSGVQVCSVRWWVAMILTMQPKVRRKFPAYWDYTGDCNWQCRKVLVNTLSAEIYRVLLEIRCNPVFENMSYIVCTRKNWWLSR